MSTRRRCSTLLVGLWLVLSHAAAFSGVGGSISGTVRDIALAKIIALRETKMLQFRVEAFNVFKHAQFTGPRAVDGDIGSTTFGNVISAASPRLLQAAIKLVF